MAGRLSVSLNLRVDKRCLDFWRHDPVHARISNLLIAPIALGEIIGLPGWPCCVHYAD